jgi:hypothetical protein
LRGFPGYDAFSNDTGIVRKPRERIMQGNRCPNCENDINDVVNAVIIGALELDKSGPLPVECPHCGESLVVRAMVQTSIEREMAHAV